MIYNKLLQVNSSPTINFSTLYLVLCVLLINKNRTGNSAERSG